MTATVIPCPKYPSFFKASIPSILQQSSDIDISLDALPLFSEYSFNFFATETALTLGSLLIFSISDFFASIANPLITAVYEYFNFIYSLISFLMVL